MKAFNNDKKLKEELLKKLRHHTELDTFIQGRWITDEKVEGNGFKGCFYGCTMQTNDNPLKKFSDRYNIDPWYCHLTEKIYEGLPDEEYQSFPGDSIEIIPTGFDFNKMKSDFHRAVLLKQLEWVEDENVIKVIHQCADLFKVPFDEIDESAAKSAAESAARLAAESAARLAAESAAWLAAESARFAAESAARFAAESAAWLAAESARFAAKSAESAWLAAESAAWLAAWLAAESARLAAESAAKSAESAESAWLAAESGKQNHYIWLRDTLFSLIKKNP